MLKIILKNGTRVFWMKDEYDAYEYDGKVLCIYKMYKLVGMYNVDIINNLILKEED
ncbi:hypothetical protein [uncultured Megamonas sp.]|uniref:hypothetical protein n=1 Tax=uncultured Megamonas sp. TaxID=286140 RepID=UPI00259BAEFB|nr:hypothetical protein [uncultured Megamonas sp.]